MRSRVNTPTLLFLSVLFIFISKTSQAQYPGMAAFRAQQSRDFMNQQMRTQMMMMGNNWRKSAGNGNSYNVTFKDSSRKEVTSFIYRDSITHKSFLILVDKKFPKSDTTHRFRKIYTDQTLLITTEDEEQGASIFGIPSDTCWTFKVISGAVSVYVRDANYLTYNRELDSLAVLGIQLDKGPIEKYDAANLAKMLATNPKATEFFNKKKYYKAINRFNKDALKASGN